jgi:hypothetical protein
MSETEYTRLAEKLGTISEIVARIDEKLTDYPDIKGKVLTHDSAIREINARCTGIQDAKKTKSVPWGNVKGAIIGGLVVGIIMLAINVIIALAK